MQIALKGLDGRRTEKREETEKSRKKRKRKQGRGGRGGRWKGHMCGKGWNELEEDSVKIHCIYVKL